MLLPVHVDQQLSFYHHEYCPHCLTLTILYSSEPQVVETDDLLEINGTAFHKPFVEKPIDAENHNIYIYFPSDYGGGAQRLFRKVKLFFQHTLSLSLSLEPVHRPSTILLKPIPLWFFIIIPNPLLSLLPLPSPLTCRSRIEVAAIPR